MTDPEELNAIASGWMKRGIALLEKNTSASLTSCLPWFDRAIALRRQLPLEENSWYRHVLAAGWMNRADALTRLGGEEKLREAIRSYDAALVVLRTLDLSENPLYRTRLGIALTNRGVTLQAQKSAAALASFDEAIAILNVSANDRLILACAWMNRGNELLSLSDANAMAAGEAAGQALLLIADREAVDRLAAETGLKARHVLCRAITARLRQAKETNAREELIATATDTVEDGMALARRWEARGENCFRSIASELFRFGARVYQMYQPRFLTEFLLEHLDPAQSDDALAIDAEMHAAAEEAIGYAFGEIQRDGFRALNTPHFDVLLARLRQFSAADTRLQELRREDERDAVAEGCPLS